MNRKTPLAGRIRDTCLDMSTEDSSAFPRLAVMFCRPRRAIELESGGSVPPWTWGPLSGEFLRR
jgi:hypothetical protein